MVVNFFQFIVDCKLGPWIESPCNATCGTNAVKTLTRKVIQPSMNGGKSCPGELKKTETCNLIPCPSKYNQQQLLVSHQKIDILPCPYS